MVGERISELKDSSISTVYSKNTRKIMKKNKKSLRDLWDITQHSNTHVTAVPGEERDKGIRNIFEERMVKNFQNLI